MSPRGKKDECDFQIFDVGIVCSLLPVVDKLATPDIQLVGLYRVVWPVVGNPCEMRGFGLQWE